MKSIYLDYNATTPVDREVATEMIPYLTELYGNPSSSHSFGLATRLAVEKAREQVATMLNCAPYEVLFTGGGTESNNMAIKGIAFAHKAKGNHLIISAIEHPAVTMVANWLETHGFELSIAEVDETGYVHPDTIKSLIKSNTILISVMHANNEVGTIQSINEIAKIAHAHGIIMHTDAAQSAGKIDTDVKELGIDLLSLAGHKLYAPKGIGALYIKRGTVIEKFIHGADHEQDMRAGTENVSHIVALGKACELITLHRKEYANCMLQTRNRLSNALLDRFPDMRINGNLDNCLPNTLNVSFKNTAAGDIIKNLPNLAVSAGAACHSSSGKSGVLEAMKLPFEYSLGAMRISTGRSTTFEEIDTAVEMITRSINRINVPEDVPGNMFNITSYANGMGCGCKMRPHDLEFILNDLPQVFSTEVLVSAGNRDDAAVYSISDTDAIVQTVDFFTPMIDNPYAFGAIAAANSLSDIYAMGAKPLFALNMVAFPVQTLPLDVLKEIMRGASDKATEAEIPVLGGHSIEDTGIKFGMVVTGRVSKSKLITNAGAKPGDVLILTKPLGSGIITHAFAKGMATDQMLQDAVDVMIGLNKVAAEVMQNFQVSACTDITGFGLIGHLHEITQASLVEASLYYDAIPLIAGTEKLARMGSISGSTKANEQFAKDWTNFTSLSPAQISIVCDAQTSGGLVISLPEAAADQLIEQLKAHNIASSIIGRITGLGNGQITIGFQH